MPNKKFTVAAAALATVLGGAGLMTLPPHYAAAQQSAAPAAPAAPAPQRPARPMRPSHIEGRIAYLKTELHITAAQDAQWDKVATALRQNDAERRQAFEQMRKDRSASPNALQHLEAMARMSAMRAQQTDRLLAAFRPLYDGLSEQQKQAANDLLGPHWHHFRRRG